MINHQEQRFLYLLASEYFQNRGGIIDAGVFLGSSTHCLVAGLHANPAYQSFDRPVITALDLCECDDYMADLVNNLYGTQLRSGDSFKNELEANLGGIRQDVDLQVGDIKDFYAEDRIELLFLDVCKDPSINNHIVRSFFPKLVPGVSVVIHQDFVHESLPWIHVSMGLLEEYFEMIGIVGDFGPSAVYLCKKQVPSSVSDIYSFGSMPVLQAAFEAAVSDLGGVRRYLVDLAYTRLLAGRGLMEQALEELDRLDGLYDQLRQQCSYLPTTARHRSRLHTSWATLR